MRDLLLLIFSILIFSTSGAQEVSENDLPERVLDSFNEEPKTPTSSSWEKEESNYSGSFDESDVEEVNLIYDENGDIIEKFESVSKEELPLTVFFYLNGKYPLQEIEKTWAKRAEGEVIYKVQLAEIITGGGSISGRSIEVYNSNEGLELDSARIIHSNYQYESTERFLYFDKDGVLSTPQRALQSPDLNDEEIKTTISRKSKKAVVK